MSLVEFPLNHKTVIVIDHGKSFRQSCKEECNISPVGNNSRTSTPNDSIVFTKSLWTCAVESVLEYCRIVFDLFPSEEKVFSLISVDKEAKVLTAWFTEDQVYSQLSKVFRDESVPINESINMESAINESMTMLMYLTQRQQMRLKQLPVGSQLQNTGRLVFFTCLNNDAEVDKLAKSLSREVHRHNNLASNDYTEYTVDFCDFVLINVMPVGSKGSLTQRNAFPISDCLHLNVYSFYAGDNLARQVMALTSSHFGLASSSIQEIPMKEETPSSGNQSVNKNYDVELIHLAEAHYGLTDLGLLDKLTVRGSHLVFPSSIGLKWITPKSSLVELIHCSKAYRFTSADVTARHSICLVNFLRQPPGRFVMLESVNRSGHRVVVHMLASHGGDVYLHVLPHSLQQPFEAATSLVDTLSNNSMFKISLSDHRSADFRELIARCRLCPASESISYDTLPYLRAIRHLKRCTFYWPPSIHDSVLYSINPANAKALFQLLSEETLDSEEVRTCECLIKNYLDMEARGQQLNPNSKVLRQQLKKEDLYRLLFIELDFILTMYSTLSSSHLQVLQCLRRFRPTDTVKVTGLAYLDRQRQLHSKMSTKQTVKITDGNATAKTGIAVKRKGISLYDWHCDYVKRQASSLHPELEGRQGRPPCEVAPLYRYLTLGSDGQVIGNNKPPHNITSVSSASNLSGLSDPRILQNMSSS